MTHPDHEKLLDDGGAAFTFTDEVLVGLVRQGRKVACPACDRRMMSQCYQPLSHSGIGQHIRASHPELEPEVLAASRRAERTLRAAKAAADQEDRERPLRQHVVTGAFLDEITGHLRSLIDMMEPYYAQSNAADESLELIDRIDAMIAARKGSSHE